MRMRAALQQILASLLSVLQMQQQYPFHKHYQVLIVFWYRSNLKYFPLKATGLAEQLMLALLQQPYGTPQNN